MRAIDEGSTPLSSDCHNIVKALRVSHASRSHARSLISCAALALRCVTLRVVPAYCLEKIV